MAVPTVSSPHAHPHPRPHRHSRARGLGAAWTKSSYSGNGNCVEVSAPAAGVAVRDSKDVSRPSLSFTGGSWRAFLAELGERAPGQV
ncbi:DUF397 domain-containing protein [Streptomyces zingiberis]|uniref:DUF397 domain-containing protein n=1 Tax=Streptomyces zingiberis TaxID=2053010 RepID=A0ABX1BTZ3_9ACTN|nr:DUF397 domain-containing protein [Streptomyces zingiberis]NJP99890.1 DUF397 domain-containing protein [Streptomyces zingiberis]